jgi:hypothetical protein
MRQTTTMTCFAVVTGSMTRRPTRIVCKAAQQLRDITCTARGDFCHAAVARQETSACSVSLTVVCCRRALVLALYAQVVPASLLLCCVSLQDIFNTLSMTHAPVLCCSAVQSTCAGFTCPSGLIRVNPVLPSGVTPSFSICCVSGCANIMGANHIMHVYVHMVCSGVRQMLGQRQ